MKIFVYGNCQAASYAAALRGMVDAEAIYLIGRDSFELARDCDVVFLQSEFWDQVTGPNSVITIAKQTLIKVPTFYFAGFAPDAIIEQCGGRTLVCPAGVYNSSIVLHGFLSGCSIQETLSLFNEDTYATLAFDRYWSASRQSLIDDMNACGVDGTGLFDLFAAGGRFAASPHHPPLRVFEPIVGELIRQHNLPSRPQAQPQADPMAINGDWPLYPGLRLPVEAPRGLDFCFDPPHPGSMVKSAIPLEAFVRRSFAAYAAWTKGSITSERLTRNAELYDRVQPRTRPRSPRRRHAYADLPSTSYWKASIAALPIGEVDPVVQTKWQIGERDKIATAGSCFAQHLARTLITAGRPFLNSEPAPHGMTPEEASRRMFGMFSARYGNIYTARQLSQLVARATGTFAPVDKAWRRPDGRFVDPFRPQIEPDGFASAADTIADTDRHLRAVLTMLQRMDVLVFTLGLTEAWSSSIDDAVFPVAPGVVAGELDAGRYRFANFTMSQVRADLRRALELMRDINPRLRVILTVSPVPLVATYESRHVLVSTTYSKSALRVAAEEIVADYSFVDYFPSYEMVTGPHTCGCYFEEDKRSVTAQGVAHVMAVFRRHYLAGAGPALPAPAPRIDPIRAEIAARSRYLCDEEALDRMSAADELRREYAQTG